MKYDPVLYKSDQRPFLREEVEFYKNLVRKLRPKTILELGVGTGRIFSELLPNVEHGIGLDISDQMLASCKKACQSLDNYELLNRNFINFNLSRTFDFIYLPFNTFQHLLTKKEQTDCLASIRLHMHKDSHFVLDVMDSKQITLDFEQWKLDYLSLMQDGRTIERYQKTVDVKKNTHVVHKVFMYKEICNNQVVASREFDALMKITPNEKLQELLLSCNFEIEDIWSDYFFGRGNMTKKKIYFLSAL